MPPLYLKRSPFCTASWNMDVPDFELYLKGLCKRKRFFIHAFPRSQSSTSALEGTTRGAQQGSRWYAFCLLLAGRKQISHCCWQQQTWRGGHPESATDATHITWSHGWTTAASCNATIPPQLLFTKHHTMHTQTVCFTQCLAAALANVLDGLRARP